MLNDIFYINFYRMNIEKVFKTSCKSPSLMPFTFHNPKDVVMSFFKNNLTVT